MGAWGVGYKDNDDYYNHISDFSEPVIAALKEALDRAEQGKFHDGSGNNSWVNKIAVGEFRSQLMWTYQVLSSVEETSLSDDEITVLTDSVRHVRNGATAGADQWRNPDEFLSAVNDELDSVQAWLVEFKPSGFLSDRLGAIIGSLDDNGV